MSNLSRMGKNDIPHQKYLSESNFEITLTKQKLQELIIVIFQFQHYKQKQKSPISKFQLLCDDVTADVRCICQLTFRNNFTVCLIERPR